MCTVTYLPTGKDTFIFTTNRDETPTRLVAGLVDQKVGDKMIKYPQDVKALGSWILISDQGQLVCILNGAFEKHAHQPPYRLSRGIMAIDFFSYKDPSEFAQNFEFKGMEPFTMIIFDQSQLYELRWDEQKIHLKKPDPTRPHIWAASPLYPKFWRDKRELWFNTWQKNNPNYSQEAILDFHKNAGEGNPAYDLKMNRYNLVRTTSITSIIKQNKTMNMRFEDLLTTNLIVEELPILIAS